VRSALSRKIGNFQRLLSRGQNEIEKLVWEDKPQI
jgi:hypothetical protein